MKKSEIRNSKNNPRPFEIAFKRKKHVAFLTTALMFFCLFCFLASFSIRDFTTLATLNVSTSNEDTTAYVRRVVEREISDEELSNHVLAAVDQAEYIANSDIATINLPGIRESLGVQIAKLKEQNKFCLTVLFHGKGGEAEQVLTSRIAHQVAGKLNSSSSAAIVSKQFREQYQLLQQQVERNSSDRHSELTSAVRMVEQLNAGLSDLHNDIESFDPDSQSTANSARLEQSAFERDGSDRPQELLNELAALIREKDVVQNAGELEVVERSISELQDRITRIGQTVGGGAFDSSVISNAPIRVVNTSLPANNPAIASLTNALNGLDTDSLQAKISQTQEALRSDAIQLREDATNLNLLGNVLADNRLVVDSISQVKTIPSGTTPGLAHVLLFAFLSTFLAAAVSMAYKPERDGIGFESTDSAANSLGLPVIAQIESEQEDGHSILNNAEGIANHVVKYCEVGLFAFLVLIVVLCIVQVDIRAAFFENPFYGLARVASLFFGN